MSGAGPGDAEAAALNSSISRMMSAVIAGKYKLVRLIGQGGMGAVYEGRNLTTTKRCAVKLLLSPELAGNAELVKRFHREARACAVIESDHTVEVFDSGADPQTGTPYMVMELLQGEDVEALRERLAPLAPAAAAKIVLQAATGLAKAHEAGIVHRDIKPANLFISQRDSGELIVKLLDFGIAKVKMDNFAQTATGLTRTGTMLGTPLYMSPEQTKGAAGVDPRTDVWSLGMVLYHLLCGSLPYPENPSFGELMVAILTADIPLLQDRAPWVAPELAEVTHRAISRALDKRFHHAGEFRDALAALIPEGPRLLPHELTAVPQEQRSYVAPRLVLTDDGMLRATTRTGLSATGPGLPAATPRSRAPLILAGVAVLGLGVAGAVLGPRFLGKPAAPPPASQPVVATPIAPAPASAPAAPQPKKFALEVGPPGVEVTIEGAAATVAGGKVTVGGLVGETRTVKLRYKGRDEEHQVAIAANGLVPARLKAAGPGARPAGAAKAGAAKAPAVAAPAKAPVAAPGKAPGKKPKPAVSTDTSEF
jgi:serine/threonine-protein kinase